MSDGTEQIGRLFTSISKGWRAILDSRLAPLGMSEARWQCLLHLSRADHALSQVDLADAMGITPPSLVKLLDRLEEDGWVLRLAEPQDRRAKRIELTDKAREMARRIEDEAQLLRQEVWEGISVDERNVFLGVLLRLEKNIEQIKPQASSEVEK
ncbi:MAG: MarR family transcriptional regulator [bacterium]|nr:MarR family transcriptional regulator [bacterium]